MVKFPVKKPVALPVVLNIGMQKHYLARRREILESAGFEVCDATDARQAVTLCRQKAPHIAIFGHLLPVAERLQMAEALRAVNSALRIVVMYDRSASKTEHADAVLQIDVPPADLVHSIEYLLDGNTAPGRTAS
ncbi:MAG TPA: hypothetical protein VGL89_06815 [Candidatus Koribacter sp.]